MLMNPLVLQPKRLEAVVFGLVEDSQVYAGLGWLTETWLRRDFEKRANAKCCSRAMWLPAGCSPFSLGVEEEAFVSSFFNLEGRFCWITWMDGPKCAMIDR